jgi:adenosylhomocysteine nucleosidase
MCRLTGSIMTNKILVAFAMKQEFAPWRRRRRFHRVATSVHPIWTTTIGATEVHAVLAGAGAPESQHIRECVARIAPSVGIVTGVAAGLTPEWRPGDVLVAQTVRAPDGEARIAAAPNLVDLAAQCGAKPAPTLVTLPRIARSVAEKERLAGIGDAADMESLPLMRQWSASRLPSVAVRVILDPVEMPMTCDFESAMDSHGQVRIAKILAQLVRHPQLLPDFLHLAKQSRRVMKILARFLDQFVEALT